MGNKFFGTDGIRGLANQYPMSPDLVLKLGQAIGMYFKKNYPHPKILIGKDTRRSGYMLEQALCSGICSTGVNVFFLGPIPTPGIAYLTRGMRACAGIVISASHNPYYDNGIKIFNSDGYKLSDAIEEELENLLTKDISSLKFPTGVEIGVAKRIEDAIGQYAVFLKEQFPKHHNLEGLRIALDCANGASYKVAPKVFEELGAEVFLDGAKPTGENINLGCGALHPEKLAKKVHLHKADIGFAFDGDADRLIIVDDKSEIIDGDIILGICANYLNSKNRLNKNSVCATIMSNKGLELSLEKFGIGVCYSKVGDRYVMDTMRKNGLNFGGEQSGHIIYKDTSTTGDGVLASLMLLEIILETGKKISELKKDYLLLPQILKNVAVKVKTPIDNLPKLKKQISEYEKNLGNKGRVLFRYSGTENLARIMVEGEDQQSIEHMANSLATTLLENHQVS